MHRSRELKLNRLLLFSLFRWRPSEVMLLDDRPGVSADREKVSANSPRILYLAGIPRTGSTVLGQALGCIPGIVFTGELSLFWRRFANRELCSCGHPLPECQFWSRIIKQGFDELPFEKARYLSELERALRRRLVIGWLFHARKKLAKSSQFQTAAQARGQLYTAIADVTQTTWIVDSGKDPWLGSLLGDFFTNSLGIVHIVRDPRGVAFSWAKLVKSDSEPGYMPRRHPGRTALSWLIQNVAIQCILQRLSGSYSRLRYEDLAADPQAVVRNLARSMGITEGQLDICDTKGSKGDLHWVAGNPRVRQSAGSPLEIKLDDEWRDRLPRVHQFLITAICGVLFPFYGYHP